MPKNRYIRGFKQLKSNQGELDINKTNFIIFLRLKVLHILDALIVFKYHYIFLMHEFQEREKRGENLDEHQEINPNKVKMAGSPSNALPWQPRLSPV